MNNKRKMKKKIKNKGLGCKHILGSQTLNYRDVDAGK
jgi:hypothetical protein